jgi:exonuclease III
MSWSEVTPIGLSAPARRRNAKRKRMRLLAWNIRQGGGTRLAAIAAALARHEADVLVISEYRGGDSGLRLRSALAALGYRHISAAAPPPGGNGVLIAARLPLIEEPLFSADLPEPYRLVAVEIRGVLLCGVYMPNLAKKVPYWQRLIDGLADHAGRAALAVGDFNTCRAYLDEAGAIDASAHFMDKIEAIGFRDLWRQRNPETREFSWYSTRGNGFRIDHAFLSAALAARAGAIRYSHDERLAGLSDHSPLILEVNAVST